jgi:hypothetical protein
MIMPHDTTASTFGQCCTACNCEHCGRTWIFIVDEWIVDTTALQRGLEAASAAVTEFVHQVGPELKELLDEWADVEPQPKYVGAPLAEPAPNRLTDEPNQQQPCDRYRTEWPRPPPARPYDAPLPTGSGERRPVGRLTCSLNNLIPETA